MRNFEALRAVRDRITFEPGKHNQDTWGQISPQELPDVYEVRKYQDHDYVQVECTSSACAAGWAITHAGDKMLFDQSSLKNVSPKESVMAYKCVTPEGRIRDINLRAMELLGLTEAQSKHMFAPYYSTEETIELLDVLLKEDLDQTKATRELKRKIREIELRHDDD